MLGSRVVLYLFFQRRQRSEVGWRFGAHVRISIRIGVFIAYIQQHTEMVEPASGENAIFSNGVSRMLGRWCGSEAISWHSPTSRKSGKRRFTVVQMRLIGLLKLKTHACGQISMISAQMSSIGGIIRMEWNKPPGPPFSPYTWRMPYCWATCQSWSQIQSDCPLRSI
jgi:hypothetical protein